MNKHTHTHTHRETQKGMKEKRKLKYKKIRQHPPQFSRQTKEMKHQNYLFPFCILCYVCACVFSIYLYFSFGSFSVFFFFFVLVFAFYHTYLYILPTSIPIHYILYIFTMCAYLHVRFFVSILLVFLRVFSVYSIYIYILFVLFCVSFRFQSFDLQRRGHTFCHFNFEYALLYNLHSYCWCAMCNMQHHNFFLSRTKRENGIARVTQRRKKRDRINNCICGDSRKNRVCYHGLHAKFSYFKSLALSRELNENANA